MINSCPNLTRVHCAELLSRGLGSMYYIWHVGTHVPVLYWCDCVLADGVLIFYSIPNSGDFVVLILEFRNSLAFHWTCFRLLISNFCCITRSRCVLWNPLLPMLLYRNEEIRRLLYLLITEHQNVFALFTAFHHKTNFACT